jgi:hypothetical protein
MSWVLTNYTLSTASTPSGSSARGFSTPQQHVVVGNQEGSRAENGYVKHAVAIHTLCFRGWKSLVYMWSHFSIHLKIERFLVSLSKETFIYVAAGGPISETGSLVPDNAKDCFARDKFADYRDDMGGVGSFNRQNRTLYVGRIKETGNSQETEEVVTRHFKEWGTIKCSAYFLSFLRGV